MNTSATGKVYTPELLSLAAALADYPFSGDWHKVGQARSRTCGSSLKIGVNLGEDSRIVRIGMAVTACAVGQASAAIFASEAVGSSAVDISHALAEIENWVSTAGAPLPPWPGISVLAPVLPHRSRHGALLLPWNAAADALCKAEIAS